LYRGTFFGTHLVEQVTVVAGCVGVALPFRQQIRTDAAHGDRHRRYAGKFAQFDERRVGLGAGGHVVVDVTERCGRLGGLTAGRVGASDPKLDISAQGQAVLFQQRSSGGGATIGDQGSGVDHVRILGQH